MSPAANATEFQRPEPLPPCPTCLTDTRATYNENIPFYLTEKQFNNGPGTIWYTERSNHDATIHGSATNHEYYRPGSRHNLGWLTPNWTVYCPSCGHIYKQGRVYP